ncbi:MAG: hypothetical protein A3I01_04420 [Betaproteobacteria bacterium RIFCSPLOWO2_02_FULL_65_24]|nr:MAG: hypothetical protein A3I01_04420 [Betaproteobacteria bacterium RIFCSPLOWO2_02_FULL_65_24]OGA77663.1 MAG: hypothetical protein A3G27_15315 [Betaproteobacteria bacterium RIFCSPLOWO2_12_FULL_66_14]
MEPKIIRTAEQYRSSLDEVRRLTACSPAPGTPEADRLELLAKLLADYECERFKAAHADAVSAIRCRMQEQGLLQKDLAPLLGGKNRVSEVLAGKRPLTLAMARRLSESLRIPAEVLLRPHKPLR